LRDERAELGQLRPRFRVSDLIGEELQAHKQKGEGLPCVVMQLSRNASALFLLRAQDHRGG
jgi:hypothetical protein